MANMSTASGVTNFSQYTVVKGVISKEKAAQYVDRIYKWLESFGTGFKADDRSTWHVNQVPPFGR